MVDLHSLVSIFDFEKEATKILPRPALGYYQSGATTEHTLKENNDAIQRWKIRPRILVDVSKIDCSTRILGYPIRVPFGVAPTAMQRMAHPDGECANARAAARMGTVFTLSTIATSSIEQISSIEGLHFFQLYIYKDRAITKQLVKRAEKAGFKALVLTVDAPNFGIRYADVRNKFSLPPHLRLANFEGEDEKSSGANTSRGGSGINEYVKSLFDPALTWKDVAWLQSITQLPIVLKGVLTPEAAIKGVNSGAAAIWVSNHGARQIDTVSSTIDVLPEIVAAVGNKCEVYIDGGFRTGTDVYKALALGAKMVFLGRPLIWGLACGGEEGAYQVLNIMKTELESTMINSGYSAVTDIPRTSVSYGHSSKL
ncbi:Peroxisomal (S)-2-hydroxy-acid oxidase GLO1 [Armadillidium nasatum]|uniref:(S)-2-hydroxy-acid oxidase n=1 Tax=Armadillidium nasatum TaxID=96803 RepID=A0A5N5T1T1_9CRUS|nr:Peroxisomal (S)-2-hydroxy-acid oxidase GLO1 [Armadillidium nasatum]